MHTDSALDLSAWLYCSGSLTQQLKNQLGNCELRILSQTWIEADNWLLSQAPTISFPVLQREIIICANALPCWYSRSYFSHALYQKESWLIERMQTEPLGHILFTDPRIERVSFEVLDIRPEDTPSRWTNLPLILQDDIAPMRWAQYRVGAELGLWVSELFLHGLDEVL